jgi:hypothetical protein
MKDYIVSFFKEFQYPAEAAESLLSEYDKLTKNTNAMNMFQKQIDLYNCNGLTDYNEALNFISKASELSGTNPYTVFLLFFICLSKHTRELYEEKNIDYTVFYDSMYDLKCKLYECHKLYGIWGTFVADWFPGFFQLTRFALRRLQFETDVFKNTYSKNKDTLNPGDTVLNVHIPSRGPLIHEDCLESYRMASVFFKDYFVQKPIAFACCSWLLFPSHKEFLPPKSNVLAFMNDFDIIYSGFSDNHGELWRIFYKEYTGNTDELPQETSMQRAYVSWLRKGNKTGYGYGVFLFDGKNII